MFPTDNECVGVDVLIDGVTSQSQVDKDVQNNEDNFPQVVPNVLPGQLFGPPFVLFLASGRGFQPLRCTVKIVTQHDFRIRTF